METSFIVKNRDNRRDNRKNKKCIGIGDEKL